MTVYSRFGSSIFQAEDRAALLRFQGWTLADLRAALNLEDEVFRVLKYRCIHVLGHGREREDCPATYDVWSHVLVTALHLQHCNPEDLTFDDIRDRGGAGLLMQLCCQQPVRFAFTPACFAMLRKSAVDLARTDARLAQDLIEAQDRVLRATIVPLAHLNPDRYPWICFPVGDSDAPVVCMLRLLDNASPEQQECACDLYEETLRLLFLEHGENLERFSRWFKLFRDVAREQGAVGPRSKAFFEQSAKSFCTRFPDPLAVVQGVVGSNAMLDFAEGLRWCQATLAPVPNLANCSSPWSNARSTWVVDPNYFFPWSNARSTWVQAVVFSSPLFK
jgi:hypothetical protein